MEDTNNANNWNTQQVLAIKFLAAGRTDSTGKKWTNEDFCNSVLKIHPSTLSHWKAMQAFRLAVLEETMGRVADFIPSMVQAQVSKAIKKQDTVAFMAIMRQSGIIKADKIDNKNDNTDNVTIKFENA